MYNIALQTVPITIPIESEPLATSISPGVPVKDEPKSWAKLVGGGNAATSTVSTSKNVVPKREVHHEKKEGKHINAQKEEKKTHEKIEEKEPKDGKSGIFVLTIFWLSFSLRKPFSEEEQRGAKLYIGGIVRNKIPELADENTVIAEIFGVFAGMFAFRVFFSKSFYLIISTP